MYFSLPKSKQLNCNKCCSGTYQQGKDDYDERYPTPYEKITFQPFPRMWSASTEHLETFVDIQRRGLNYTRLLRPQTHTSPVSCQVGDVQY